MPKLPHFLRESTFCQNLAAFKSYDHCFPKNELMTSSDIDIFSAYECLRNDKTQKRFMSVLDLVKSTIMAQVDAGALSFSPFPSPTVYIGAISSLLVHRLDKKQTDGLPELLRLLHVALESGVLDSTISSHLLSSLVPLMADAGTELAIALSPVVVQLTKHSAVADTAIRDISNALCAFSLSDDPRLRKAAAQAIYDFRQIHGIALDTMFELADRNPLRALTVVNNIAYVAKENTWAKYLEKLMALADSQNRAVRAKALQVLACALFYLPVETTVGIVNKFARLGTDVSGDLLVPTAELLQAAIAVLAKHDMLALKANFPEFLHQLMLLLTVGDDESKELINNIIRYGIHSVISDGNLDALKPIMEEFSQVMGVQYVTIWPQLFSILQTIPEKTGERTFELMGGVVMAALEKLTNVDSNYYNNILYFIASCAEKLGLGQFFELTQMPVNDYGYLENMIIPILNIYRGKCVDDLSFVYNYILPMEEEMHEELRQDPSRILWQNLWNVLPNCCSTNMEDISDFVNLVLNRFDEHKMELYRPICKIIQIIAPHTDQLDRMLISLANASVDTSTSSCVIPAIAKVASLMQQDSINTFFSSLVTNKILVLANNPNQISIACALVDVALALMPYLSNEYRGIFYKMLISFIGQNNNFQKKALRSLRTYLQNYPDPSVSEELLQVLNQTSGDVSSSKMRYRLLLMSTLLRLPGTSNYDEMIKSFLPEFIGALKDHGVKTRAAGEECISGISSDLIKKGLSLTPLLLRISVGLTSNSSSFVSASIEAINCILNKYPENINPDELEEFCLLIFKSTDSTPTSEVYRSALSFAKSLIKCLPKYVGSRQLSNILMLSVNCNKKTNWEIKGKGHKMIERCISIYGIDDVTRCFPQGEEKLLRGARKEVNKDVRKKNENKEEENKQQHRIELDSRFDTDVHDLNDPRETVSRIVQSNTDMNDEGLEFDKRGRLVLKDAPKKQIKNENDDEESDDGRNEVADHIRQRKIKQKHQQRQSIEDSFIAESGKKFKSQSGKGDSQKGSQKPYAFAPLSSKIVNKRYKGQMKAAYKKLFKNSK